MLSEQNEADTTKEEPGSGSALFVNSTSANTLCPGEIRKIMPTTNKIKATSNNNQIAFSSDFNLNGNSYRECSQHLIYCVTKSSLSSHHSLVDRRANEEVSGSDVRFFENHTDRKVEIRSIDNHQISAITLVTFGGVTITITGKVIVIMHQCANHGKKKNQVFFP